MSNHYSFTSLDFRRDNNEKYGILYICLSILVSACAGGVNRMSATFGNTTPILAQQFYNQGLGFDIPGEPVGDSIIAFGGAGGRPNGDRSPSIINNRQSARQINGNKDIVCHRAEENNNNYAVWRPREVDFNPIKTSFLSTISVDPNMTVRLIFSENKQLTSSGFTPSPSDLAVLEISDNSLWAWHIGKTFHGNSGTFRRRIGDYNTPDPRRGATTGEVVSVTFNREENTCNVVVAPGGINENLGPEFCNVTDSSKVVIAVQALTSNSTNSQFFCTSVMVVNSVR